MLPMVSFAVNVMVTMSFTFAKDVIGIVAGYRQSLARDGSIVSITVLLLVISSWCYVEYTFPVLSYAVIVKLYRSIWRVLRNHDSCVLAVSLSLTAHVYVGIV